MDCSFSSYCPFFFGILNADCFLRTLSFQVVIFTCVLDQKGMGPKLSVTTLNGSKEEQGIRHILY